MSVQYQTQSHNTRTKYINNQLTYQLQNKSSIQSTTKIVNLKPQNYIDLTNFENVYKFVNTILSKSLSLYKKDNRKPFKLSRNFSTIIVSFPSHLDNSLYKKWYNAVEKELNKNFYRKEDESEEEIVPEIEQRTRLFTKINNKEQELKVNIVVRGIPIYKPQKKQTHKIVSEDNKKNIQQIKHKKLSVPIRKELNFNDSDYDTDSEVSEIHSEIDSDLDNDY